MVKWSGSCRGSWNFTRFLTNYCGEKKLESDGWDASHTRLPCVRNEYTMQNKHLCCVLSWSGHDILKLSAVPALLLQRQIVQTEFHGVALKAPLQPPNKALRESPEIYGYNLIQTFISVLFNYYQTQHKPPD